ncbi:MAG: isoprenylcysteine carboxylmethyltransferase family protein [Acidobacteria bacterium]|nr:isoprenylcysteine carboxylmethyltransferase family protein [Acidobacteriota bacterium]
MSTTFTALRSLVYASGFVTVWAWLVLGLRKFDGDLGLLPEWLVLPGILLMVLGATLALSSIALFIALGRGTPAPFDAPRRLVAAGPFQWVRNPMYIGGLVVLSGFAMFHRSPSMLLFAFLWSFFAHLLVILYEEPILREKFGREYEDYVERVPRWIPRLGTSRN